MEVVASSRDIRNLEFVEMNYIFDPSGHTMIPEPHELFDIDRGSDKLFMIGTAWIVLFLFLL